MDPQSPVPPQPQQPQQPQPVPAAPQGPAEQPGNPGQTLGIVGIVLGVFGLGLIGIVLSIMSIIKSRKAQQPIVLGVIGVVISALTIVITCAIFVFTFLSYNGISTRAHDSTARANAFAVEKRAEAYFAYAYSYPTGTADFARYEETSLNAMNFQVIDGEPRDYRTIGYKACGANGAEVIYYQASTQTAVPVYLGDGSEQACAQ